MFKWPIQGSKGAISDILLPLWVMQLTTADIHDRCQSFLLNGCFEVF